MSINVPGILSSPVSRLPLLDGNEYLSDESLFLVENHQSNNEKKTPSGYVSRRGLYQQLTSTLVSDFRLEQMNADLENMEMSLEVPSTYVELENSRASRRFILSAISENTRASINGVSAYNMTEALKDILNKVQVPKVSATVSPWVKTSQIATTTGNSQTDVAAQKLMLSVTNEADSGKYLERSKVKNTILNSLAENAAAQSLITGVERTTENEIINVEDVVNVLGTSDDRVASQALVSYISNAIQSNYHRKSDLADSLGDSRTIGVQVALLNNLSNNIKANFISIEDAKKYLTTEKVVSYLGNSTTMVASQKLATDVSSAITNIKNELISKFPDPPEPHINGNVYYLTPDGKGKSQTIASDQIFLCESDSDIKITTSQAISLKNIFDKWTLGGHYGNYFYETSPESYPKMKFKGLDALLACYGIPKDDIETADREQLITLLNATKKYGEISAYYMSNYGYDIKLDQAYQWCPLSHVFSVWEKDEMWKNKQIFSTDDISDVLFDVELPNGTKCSSLTGTCLYHLSGAQGKLWENFKSSTIHYIHNSEISNVISSSWKDVLNSSIRALPTTDIYIHNDDYGYGYWIYNSTLSTIVQIKNSTDHTYYISTEKLSSYDITFRCYSTNSDDDYSGFIAAYSTYNKNPISLGVLRTINHTNNNMPMIHWAFHINQPWTLNNIVKSGHIGSKFTRSDGTRLLSEGAILDIAELSVKATNHGRYAKSYVENNLGGIEGNPFPGEKWTYEGGAGNGWVAYPDGVLIRVKRNGNKISAWTTEFGQKPIKANLGHLISVDLEDKETNYFGLELGRYLSCFQGEHEIGFQSQSQPQSMYELVDWNVPMRIGDIRNNTVSSYNGEKWAKEDDKIPSTVTGSGRLSQNPYTKKLFFSTQGGFIKLYQP